MTIGMEATEAIINGWVRVKEPDKYAGAKGQMMSLFYHKQDENAYFNVFIQDKLGFDQREVCSEDLEHIPLSVDVFERNGFIGKEEGHYYSYTISDGKNYVKVHYQNHLKACSTPDDRNEFALFGIIVLETVMDLQLALLLCKVKKSIEL